MIRDAHDNAIVSLHFFASEPVLMSASADNSIKVRLFYKSVTVLAPGSNPASIYFFMHHLLVAHMGKMHLRDNHLWMKSRVFARSFLSWVLK